MAATALLIAEVNVNTLLCDRAQGRLHQIDGSRNHRRCWHSVVEPRVPFYPLLPAHRLHAGRRQTPWRARAFCRCLRVESWPPRRRGLCRSRRRRLLLGSEAQVDKANSVFFIGVLVSFALLVGVGSSSIDPTYLAHASPAAALPAIPVMVLSFTFHNVVPTIAYQLGCDLEKIKVAILAGSAIPLAMFLLWNGVVLGAVPYDAAIGVAGTFDPLETLRASGETFGEIVRVFSLLAIVTSFIGFCYGLVDFYADVLNVDEKLAAQQQQTAPMRSTRMMLERSAAVWATTGLCPSRRASLLWRCFRPWRSRQRAKAGSFSLRSIMPAPTASSPSLGLYRARWRGACGTGPEAEPFVPPALPGGKLTLGAMIGGAVVVIGLELAEKFGGAFA